MTAPIITLGRTEADGQIVEFWIDQWPNQAATMHRGGRRNDTMTIYQGCPNEWLPGITGIWQLLGDNPDADLTMHATHRLNTDRWANTTLEPLDREPAPEPVDPSLPEPIDFEALQ